MNLPAYPNYKPSGVEWLGDVPEHWEVKRLKTAAQLNDRKVEADGENPVPYIGMENIESWTGRLLPIDLEVVPTGTANAFKRGNTLFGKLRPYLAKACNPEFDGLCSTELLVLKPRELTQAALCYTLLSDGFVKLVDSSTYGSKMPRASWDFIGNCSIPIPSKDEQRAIAGFLDERTGKLDGLAEKKRGLIEKLKEKRSALISRTVTQGLPPEAAAPAGIDPQMAQISADEESGKSSAHLRPSAKSADHLPKLKPSGIAWLGDIPEHWELKRLKFVVDWIEQGWSPECESRPAELEEWGVVKTGCCNGGLFNAADNKTLPHGLDPIASLEIKVRDVLMSRASGSEDLIGSTALVPIGCRPRLLLSDKTYRLHLNLSKIIPEFLVSVFQCPLVRFQIARLINGASGLAKNIAQSDVKTFVLPLPPLPEQTAIADYLDRETAKIDRLIAKVEAALQKLAEYRTALITAAVTGKIDVRATSAALAPD